MSTRSTFFWALLVSLLTSCGRTPSLPTPISGETGYRDPELRFAFTYPSSWTRVATHSPRIVVKVKDETSGSAFHVFVTASGLKARLFPGAAVDSFTRGRLERLVEDNLPGAALTSSSVTSIGGRRAVLFQSHSGATASEGSSGVDTLWFITVKNGKVFMGSCYGPSQRWENLKPQCESIFATFTFL